MKKKIKAIVLMLVCVFALAACGTGEPKKMVEDPSAIFNSPVKTISFLISRNDAELSQYMGQILMDPRSSYADVYSFLSEYGDYEVDAKLKQMLIDREVLADKDIFTGNHYDKLSERIENNLYIHVDARTLFDGILAYGDARELLGDNELESFSLAGHGLADVVPDSAIEYDVKADEVIAEVHFKTTDPNGHDGIVEIIFDKDYCVTSINVNTVLNLGESMERAGVNTLIGMGSVFIMLIVIAIIISLLKFVPMILDGLKGKPVEKTEESLDKTIAGIVEREEAQEIVEDDTELVAVIAAAIAASEGAASTEGFVVRSIRRVR